MTALVSRVLVAAVLLPVVFLLIWAGGWWMVGLAAVVAMIEPYRVRRLMAFARKQELAPTSKGADPRAIG